MAVGFNPEMGFAPTSLMSPVPYRNVQGALQDDRIANLEKELKPAGREDEQPESSDNRGEGQGTSNSSMRKELPE